MHIALFGYGKMGKEVEQILLARKHSIGLLVDLHNANSFTLDELKKCDAAIEFTTPHTAIGNILKCFEANVPVVVGTTGWYDKLEEVKKICTEKNQCLFYASNFSVGVNIFFKVNEQLAKMMNNHSEYQISVEEIHHIHKLDAPSGTAISLGNQIINNILRKKKRVNKETKNPEELEIISTRTDEVPGTHIVKYFSAIDDIEIMHKAHSRKGFAMGAVLAAEFAKGKKGIFGMNDMLRF